MNPILTILCSCLLSVQILSAQSISLAPITELRCNSPKGKIHVSFSNRGKDPLRLLDLQSSHSAIQITAFDKTVKPSGMGYIVIEYNLDKIPKAQATVIVMQTNDYKQSKTTLILKYSD